MTTRISACRELAEDKNAIRKLIKVYDDLEHGVTATSVLYPRLYSLLNRNSKSKEKATMELYGVLSAYIEMRRKDQERTADAIDAFIADGCDNSTIVSVGLFFYQTPKP